MDRYTVDKGIRFSVYLSPAAFQVIRMFDVRKVAKNMNSTDFTCRQEGQWLMTRGSWEIIKASL